MKLILTAGGLVSLLVVVDGVCAQTLQRNWLIVQICHGNNSYSVKRSDGSVLGGGPLEDTIGLNVRESETVRIEVQDPNPLLFAYSAGAIERTASTNADALREFREALRALAGDTAASDQRPPPEVDVRERLTWDLRESVGELYGRAEQIPRLIRESARAGGDCSSANERRERVKSDVEAWDVGGLGERIGRHYDTLHGLALEMLREPREGAESAVAYLLLALNLETAVRATLQRVQAFVQNVEGIDVPTVVVGEIPFERRYRQTVKVGINVVSANAEVVERTNRRTDAMTFIVDPYSAIEFRIGAGVVWTNVGRVGYSARESADGFVIEETIEYSDVSAMLNLVPRWLRSVGVIGFFQLGTTGVDRDAVILAGGGLVLGENALSVSGGYAVGRGEKLFGQNVGDFIATANGIETRRGFRQGGYMSFTISF